MLDLTCHKELSPAGKRVQPGRAAKATIAMAAKGAKSETAERRSCGRRLRATEKLDVADKRQVLLVIDVFIERGQLNRKVESRTA